MTGKRLVDLLNDYVESDRIPFHMPGHKRNELDYLSMLSSKLDITEIPGFDNLHCAEGILKESMEKAAELFGAYRSFYLVNGSTCGILSAIYALSPNRTKIIIERNCHISVYNAVELCGLEPVYLYPKYNTEFGIFEGVTADGVKQLLDENPDAGILVITSPTYEGVVSDIGAVCAAAHSRGVKVIVDSAHGAHLGFGKKTLESPVALGADIVVQSLHKTLPSLTGTAIAHVADSETAVKFEKALNIFQTTSPSYLMLASIDGCIDWLSRHGEESIDTWIDSVDVFRHSARVLKQFKILDNDNLDTGVTDRGKLLIKSSRGEKGITLYNSLRCKYLIEPEMYTEQNVLIMTSPMDSAEAFEKLFSALVELDSEYISLPETASSSALMPPRADLAVLPSECRCAELESVKLASAAGRICGEYICSYPPGIPILAPGELISSDIIDYIIRSGEHGVKIRHLQSKDCECITVIK